MHGWAVTCLALLASSTSEASFLGDRGLSPYAPVAAACPSTPLVRSAASGVNTKEAAYISKRYSLASKALASFLAKTDSTFPVLNSNQYPKIGLANGGGGLRGLLISAGVHKGFDAEEPTASSSSTSGLYQAVLYEAALSGSAIGLYSYVQNNWPLTSTLSSTLWEPHFAAGLSHPPGSVFTQFQIQGQVFAKMSATGGLPISFTDVWGRVFSYGTSLASDAGLTATVSGFSQLSGITSFKRPYPIITALGIDNAADGCGLPPLNATQYEFTMDEFGSWEPTVGHFMSTKYLGTSMKNGVPLKNGSSDCVNGFDNAGWIASTSSSTFNQPCGTLPNGFETLFDPVNLGFISSIFSAVFKPILGTSQQYWYSLMPNPFFGLSNAPEVSASGTLALIDGGESIQVTPIWPFLYRDVDTLIINDNSADNPSNYQKDGETKPIINFPSGLQLHHTVVQAKANGLSHRLPTIPPPKVFMAKNYNKNPMTFFGCSLSASSPAMFLVYLPNRDVVFDSNVPAGNLTWPVAATQGMIANGEAIANNNGDPNFARCMACGIMKRSVEKAGKALPKGCAACFTQYCAANS